ncbi:MAG TPA: adenylyltransferase/cytidyltransferase family protein [Legionellaceae bacterium]|nr:adenylyltransferase/cytidyltransferase family protein [Legionellaceae bacterium]
MGTIKPKAIYPGSFNPPTLAHQNIWEQARSIFDVTVVVAQNPDKITTSTDRIDLIEDMGVLTSRIYIAPIGQSIVDTCEELKTRYIIRGLRGPSDFEHEAAYADFIRKSSDGYLQVIYFMTPAGFQHISSSLVRSIMKLNNWMEDRLLDPYVPKPVIKSLELNPDLV